MVEPMRELSTGRALPGASYTVALAVPAIRWRAAMACLGAVLLSMIGVSAAAMLAAVPAEAALGLVGSAGLVVTVAFARSGLDTFGVPNAVTTIRLGLALALPLMLPTDPTGPPGWAPAVIAATALALDGVDGWLARRLGQRTEFGARFDMEVDTVLLVTTTFALLSLGRAGPWVLLGPALRPVFVLAGALFPWLAAPLPPSRRRRAVCGTALGALVLALTPLASPTVGTTLAGLAVSALAGSFLADIAWLACRRRDRAGPGALSLT